MAIVVQPAQWLIAAPGHEARATSTIDVAGWSVHLGERATCTVLQDSAGTVIGCLLGHSIDIAGQRFLSAPARLPFRAAELEPGLVEGFLADLGGAFTALIATDRINRVYPSASCTCVWREDAPLIAAAPASLLTAEAYQARLDRELVAAMDIEQLGWLPAGLTAHHGVRRLLPHHHLDLTQWSMARHWAGPAVTAADPETTVAEIGAVMSRSMAAVAAKYQVQLALTAGRDSRAVLAACRGIASHVDAFTIGHDTAGPDREVPLEMCRALGLRHRVIGQRLSTQEESARWLMLSGHCVGGSNLRLHRTVGCFGAGEAVVTGAAGEVGRGYYWNRGDGPSTRLTGERMLARMDLKPHPKAVEAMRAWLAGLEGHDTRRILDLAYVELRLGCWSAPQSHGYPEACYHFAPLDQRRIFDALLSLPDDWRSSGRYIDALIAGSWPELVRWPFNRFRGARHYAHLAGKVLSWDRIRRKLRRHVLAQVRG